MYKPCPSLVKFVENFVLFDGIKNEIVFLVSFSDYSLPM